MLHQSAEVVIIGGGIAGLSTAWRLAERGVSSLLLEREMTLASHSSARNAAIWLPFDDDATTPPLAKKTAELMDSLLGREGWLDAIGGIVVSDVPEALAAAERGFSRTGLTCQRWTSAQVKHRFPMFAKSSWEGLFTPDAGVMDIHAMTDGIARAARRAGATLCTDTAVSEVLTEKGAVTGVRLEDGQVVASARIVIASGAWAASHGLSAGVARPLIPLRRHLAQLAVSPLPLPHILWELGHRLYVRPESGGMLACPCDEQPFAPCLPPVDVHEVERLAERLPEFFHGFEDAEIRHSWACLRTFAPDRELILGRDSACDGLYWIAGLGGRGMTVGAGAGDWLAACMQGGSSPLTSVVRADRFTDAASARQRFEDALVSRMGVD